MKVLILLSTWNGEKYLREQISSIFEQKFDGKIELVIRDDGSTDGTVEIATELNDGRIRIILGENLGAKGSFLALINGALHSDADFVAFADQDDIWLPNKLARVIDKLKNINVPALYCSALNLVDENLHSLGKYEFADRTNFKGAFFTNCATGCTCVINRPMLNFLVPLPDHKQIIMHDWWLYIVAANFGKVVYDMNSFILYRQHANNQVGMRTGFSSFIYRTRKFIKRSNMPTRMSQAHEFQRLYNDRLSAPNKTYLAHLIACCATPFKRLLFLLFRRPRRQNIFEEIVSSFTFLIGR